MWWRRVFPLNFFGFTFLSLQTVCYISSLLEIVTIVASATPSSPLSSKIISTIILSDNPVLAASSLRITSFFLVGWLLIMSRGLIRHSCHRALVKMFTFQVGIQKITNSVVRHLSYTTIFILQWGYSICLVAGGSWLSDCSDLSLDGILARVLIFVWMMNTVVLLLLFIPGTKEEDNLLREEFSEWDEWPKRV